MSARGSTFGSLGAGLALLAGVALVSGCHKKVKAQFERPPASASVPEERVNVADEQPDADGETLEAASERTKTSEPADESPPPRKRLRRRPAPPPEPPVEPGPPRRPQLSTGEESGDVATIRGTLARADDLLLLLRNRTLSDDQRQQVEAAQAFVAQARRALQDGDFVRASVLGDKGFILAEDVERSSH